MAKILVVDDEANVAKSVMRLLEEQGFQVFTAENGKNALDILNSESDISVVISDQRMPVMTGADLFKQMQLDHPLVKRVLLTGYTEMETLRKAINQGSIFRLLLKPWDDSELINCIQEAVAAFNLERENRSIKEKLTKLNINLERSVDQKNRELSMNIHSLERYELIISQLPIGIICLSDEGMIVLANKQFYHDFNIDHAIEGLPFNRILPAEMNNLIENFEDGRHHTIETDTAKFDVTSNFLRDNNHIFGKTLSIRVLTK